MESEDAILAFAALAQNTRLDTFKLLVRSEPEGVPAGELARSAAIPQNTMSSHLAILSRAGLVVSERRGRSIIYRANLKIFQALTLFMIEDCCGGDAAQCEPLLATLIPCCPPATSRKQARKLRTKA